jgi:hypothetical protein
LISFLPDVFEDLELVLLEHDEGLQEVSKENSLEVRALDLWVLDERSQVLNCFVSSNQV